MGDILEVSLGAGYRNNQRLSAKGGINRTEKI